MAHREKGCRSNDKKVMQGLKSHGKTEKGVFQSLQSGNGASARWFWRVTQFRQRMRDRAKEGAVVCGIAFSPTLRCLSGGPEFCMQVLCGRLAAVPPGNSAESIGGLLQKDPRHHLVEELAKFCHCWFCIEGLLLFVHELIRREGGRPNRP